MNLSKLIQIITFNKINSCYISKHVACVFLLMKFFHLITLILNVLCRSSRDDLFKLDDILQELDTNSLEKYPKCTFYSNHHGMCDPYAEIGRCRVCITKKRFSLGFGSSFRMSLIKNNCPADETIVASSRNEFEWFLAPNKYSGGTRICYLTKRVNPIKIVQDTEHPASNIITNQLISQTEAPLLSPALKPSTSQNVLAPNSAENQISYFQTDENLRSNPKLVMQIHKSRNSQPSDVITDFISGNSETKTYMQFAAYFGIFITITLIVICFIY